MVWSSIAAWATETAYESIVLPITAFNNLWNNGRTNFVADFFRCVDASSDCFFRLRSETDAFATFHMAKGKKLFIKKKYSGHFVGVFLLLCSLKGGSITIVGLKNTKLRFEQSTTRKFTFNTSSAWSRETCLCVSTYWFIDRLPFDRTDPNMPTVNN